MSLIWPDYIIIVLIAISTAISVARGFVREAMALAGWVLAIWIGLLYMHSMAIFIDPYLNLPPSVLAMVAFAILFIITLILSALVGNMIASLVEHTGLSGTDRAIGMLFGIARGILIVGVLVLLAGFTLIPQDPWWKESVLIPNFQQLAVIIKAYLPSDIAVKIHY